MNRQERRIGRGAFFPQGRHHDLHDGLEALQHEQQRGVEQPGTVALGGGLEGVGKAEPVKEGAQHGIVVVRKALVRAEWIRHLCQRLAQMLAQHVLVRHVVRHLAQAIHVVGKGDQPRRHLALRDHLEGLAHHGGARDLAERADMRQSRRAVARLEQRLALARFLQPHHQLAGFLERPGSRDACGFDKGWIKRGHGLQSCWSR